MSLSNSSETGLMTLLFNNTAWANVGNTGGLQPSSAAGSFYISLHTATLTGSSTQSTSEAAYTGYSRVAVARASGAGGWTISGNAPTSATNYSAVTFGACTAGSETETYFAIGLASSGAGAILYSGALTSSLAVSSGITPSFAASNCTAQMT